MTELALPTTRYAHSGEVSIAYQVMGDGPVDLILVPGIVSHVEFLHEFPAYTDYLRRLAAFARVITFDKRGQGLSDRVSGIPLSFGMQFWLWLKFDDGLREPRRAPEADLVEMTLKTSVRCSVLGHTPLEWQQPLP